MHYIILLTFFVVYSLEFVTSCPVLQRKVTPHPIKRQNESPMKTKTAPKEVSEIQHVRALVCLKCILVFDEFKSFYDHKCQVWSETTRKDDSKNS